MTRDEALVGISSPDSEVRLKSARFFAMNAGNGDRDVLRAACRVETVPWIQKALERSLEKIGPAPMVATSDSSESVDIPESVLAELRAAAIDEVASTIIHELATIVGRLRLQLKAHVIDYEGSRTETLVESLGGLLTGIRNLKTAASRPVYTECDLAAECAQACEIIAVREVTFRFAGPSPFLVELDVGLLKLALTNVLRNSVEAMCALPEGAERTVTVNWGRAGHEYWITVIDSGPGFGREPSSMVNFGVSTKIEHPGFGLATAKQAMKAMEGDIYPANAVQGGARVEMRWFGGDEHTSD